MSFNSKRGYLDRPLDLRCGQCVGCRIDRSREWALRCVHEASLHTRPVSGAVVPNNSFVTLTYDDAHLPADRGLHVEDWQLFAKRLRDRVGRFRFFMCGEYGEKTLRPHFHACVFGQDFSGDRVELRTVGENKLYYSPLLSEIWGKGLCPFGSVTFESAAYVARYVINKITGKRYKDGDHHYWRYDSRTGEYWDVRPEFACMSRRPGLGAGWFEKYSEEVFPADEVVHAGKRFRPPSFYLSQLPESDVEAIKVKRRAAVASQNEDFSIERLHVREVVAEARLSNGKRFL